MTTIKDIDSTTEQVDTTIEIVYTAPVTAPNFDTSKLNGGAVYNESSSDVNFTLHIVKSTESPTVANTYFNGVIHAGRSDLLSQVVGANLTLTSGDTIQVLAGTASALNLKLSLIEKYT